MLLEDVVQPSSWSSTFNVIFLWGCILRFQYMSRVPGGLFGRSFSVLGCPGKRVLNWKIAHPSDLNCKFLCASFLSSRILLTHPHKHRDNAAFLGRIRIWASAVTNRETRRARAVPNTWARWKLGWLRWCWPGSTAQCSVRESDRVWRFASNYQPCICIMMMAYSVYSAATLQLSFKFGTVLNMGA